MRRSLGSRGGWVGAWALLAACHSEPRHEPVCTPGAFRACAHPCGRGVEQCNESGTAWTQCACVILDASLPVAAAGAGGAGGGDGGGGGAAGAAGGDQGGSTGSDVGGAGGAAGAGGTAGDAT